MATEKLTLWVLDPELKKALIGLPLEAIQSYDWNWKEFHTALLKGLDQGSAPDLIEFGSTWTNRLTQEGVLLNITRFATENLNAASTFFPRTLHSCKDPLQIDQYYAVPLLADIRVLFYNNDHLDSYLSNHPNAFKSWNAFEEMCQALKEKFPHQVIAWPLGRDAAFHDLLPWVWTAGGDFVSLSHQVLINSEYTQKAIYRLARLILTDCAPIPPDASVNTLVRLWTQFITENITMMTGALWITRAPGWQERFKATLYPPDLFPATFTGGSNLAIVRKKYEDDENAKAYQAAKDFLSSMVGVDHQLKLARAAGKLPCNISAWEQMRKQAPDKSTLELLETFNEALCYTVDCSMPNLPNFTQIEEELKTCVEVIWKRVGEIKRGSSGAPLEKLEAECKLMIHQELTKAKQEIEKFITGYAVQYTQGEVKEIGITSPGQFDLWLEVTSSAPLVKGKVYLANREEPQKEIQKGIGPKPFQLLLALASAPQRTLSQEKLLKDVWGYKSASDYKIISDISSQVKQLSVLVELLEISLEPKPGQLLEELQHKSVPPYSTVVNLLREGGKWPDFGLDLFRSVVCQIIDEHTEEIEYVTDISNRAQAIDNLRNTYNGLYDTLGQIRGKPVINRSRRDDEYFYYLDRDLSICLVTP